MNRPFYSDSGVSWIIPLEVKYRYLEPYGKRAPVDMEQIRVPWNTFFRDQIERNPRNADKGISWSGNQVTRWRPYQDLEHQFPVSDGFRPSAASIPRCVTPLGWVIMFLSLLRKGFWKALGKPSQPRWSESEQRNRVVNSIWMIPETMCCIEQGVVELPFYMIPSQGQPKASGRSKKTCIHASTCGRRSFVTEDSVCVAFSRRLITTEYYMTSTVRPTPWDIFSKRLSASRGLHEPTIGDFYPI